MLLQMDSDMCLLYIRLLCTYEPENVFKYLSTHTEDYPLQVCAFVCLIGPSRVIDRLDWIVQETLALVQQHQGIMDANAYLLESAGNVTSAMSLILSHLDRLISDLQARVLFVFGFASMSENIAIFYATGEVGSICECK